MTLFAKLTFVIGARLRLKTRISWGAYLKGYERIYLGGKCKIHSDVSIDASKGGEIICGDRVTLNRHAYLQGGSEGIRLGDGVEINNYTIINGTGGVTIGTRTLIGPGVKIISYQHRFDGHRPIIDQPSDRLPINIGPDVWIGANVVILGGVTIGEGAVIGAGSVVTKDVPAWTLSVGVPAPVVRYREAETSVE